MADMDLETAANQLKSVAEFADAEVGRGALPADCRDLFIAEIFRSALRLSEGEAMLAAQQALRDKASGSGLKIVKLQ